MKTKRLMAILGSVTTVAWLLVASAACSGCSDDDNGGNNNVNQNNNTNNNTNDNTNNNTNDNNNQNNNNNNNTEQKKLTLIETTDIHSHAKGFNNFLDYTPLDTSDNDDVVGGLARVTTVINQIRAQKAEENIPVVLVDDGDFFMGTTYDMATDYPIALMFFQTMGYTATTIGNHEYDWGPAGLALLYGNAVTNGGFSIPVLATNTVFDATNTADDDLEALKSAGVIMDKYVTTLDNGLKIGFLGNMGPQADDMAPTAPPVTFNHDYDFMQEKVDDLRNNDNVDLVIMLSHGGLHTGGTGDDANLAANVDGIDIVCSGHYHELTPTPYNINDTLVFISGAYTDHVAQLDTTWDMTADGAKLADSHLNEIPIDDSIMGDATMQALIDQYDQGIDAKLLPAIGMAMASPVADLDFPLIVQEYQYIELNIGNLVADAMRTVASAIVAQQGQPPFDLAVIPAGVLRDDLLPGMTGTVCFSDVFSTVPLGVSPDPANRFAPGWPLVEAYLTGEEMRLIGEVALTLSLAMGDYTLWTNVSGVRYDYDSTGTPLNKISTVHLCGNTLPSGLGGDEDYFSLTCNTTVDTNDTSTLYHVVTDLYTLLMLHMATSHGVNIVPKHADGSPVDLSDPTDYMAMRIDSDPGTAGIQEIKDWMALLFFLQSLPDTDTNNLPNIPKLIYDQDTGLAMGRYNKTN